MKLTEEQKLKINENLKASNCPHCGNKGYLFEEDKVLLHLPSFNIDNEVMKLNQIEHIDAVYFTCASCGFISLFRLQKLVQ